MWGLGGEGFLDGVMVVDLVFGIVDLRGLQVCGPGLGLGVRVYRVLVQPVESSAAHPQHLAEYGAHSLIPIP